MVRLALGAAGALLALSATVEHLTTTRLAAAYDSEAALQRYAALLHDPCAPPHPREQRRWRVR